MPTRFLLILLLFFTHGRLALYADSYANGAQALVGVFWYDGTLFLPRDRFLLSEDGYGRVPGTDFQKLDKADRELVEASINLLEEARLVFSGVLYGWKFYYRPSDKFKQVKEIFTLEPIAEIQVGDPNLEPLAVDHQNGSLLRMHARYYLGEKDQHHLAFRSSPSLLFASGQGNADMVSNFEGRKEAIRQSVKEAIRAYQRKRMHAKPESLSGIVFLEKPPRVYLKSGKFVADTRILFQVTSTKKYLLP
ncbi:MAG: hypothetical protein ACRCVN_04045 [Spirochaetia bacterium]